jgi:hypothetical protein
MELTHPLVILAAALILLIALDLLALRFGVSSRSIGDQRPDWW